MTNGEKETTKKLLSDKSFKKKPIFLELFNYTFSHKPIEEFDNSFIGREKLICRIRSFIDDSVSSSGAYLITGFRGMGKTSLVNKVLEVYKSKDEASKSVTALWFLSLALLFPIELLGDYRFHVIVVIIILVGFSFIIYSNPKKEKKHGDSFLQELVNNSHHLISLLAKNPFKKDKYRFPNSLRNIVIILIWFDLILLNYYVIDFLDQDKIDIHTKFWINNFLTIILYQLLSFDMNNQKLSFIVSICSVVIGFMLLLMGKCICFFYLPSIVIISGVYLWVKIGKRDEYDKSKRGGLSSVKVFFSFNKYLIVKVNLGKDLLTDIDVLKYTTSSILNAYSNWRKPKFVVSHIFRLVVPYLVLFIGFIFIGNQNAIKRFNTHLLSDSVIPQYFPSQILLAADSRGLTDFDKKVKERFSKIIEETRINNGREFLVSLKDLVKEFESEDTEWLINIDSSQSGLLINSTQSMDYYLAVSYHYFRKALIGDSHSKLLDKYFPITIDYFVIALLLMIWLLFVRLNVLHFFGIVTHKSIINRLTNLKERIDASIVIDKGFNTPMVNVKGFNIPLLYRNKKVKYSPLDSKDIEVELMNILEKIALVPSFLTSVRPIIIYDELDKITPNHNYSLQLKEDEKGNSTQNYKIKRQENIISILSSLKAYLSNSAAKFIFIAGRDMYDAALAGISDRQSILDSIFHDNKLYVPSFYSESEDSAVNDITSMTERYICRYLMPSNEDEKWKPNLKEYNKYLRKDKAVGLKERKIIILTLSNLFTYITYRSNGAPKQISSIFEEFIVSGSSNIRINLEKDKLVIAASDDRLLLSFSYYDQYRLSFLSYLITPIFFKLGSYINEFSDKILVSISYLVDHIFKFHNHAFSKQNLALTPEIIDINKEPEFRPFLLEILNDLSISHLRKILSGLHEYRFQSKIGIELKFLNMLNAQESAAFNFTLDESLESKRFFYRRLYNLREQYSRYIDNDPQHKLIDSLTLYYMILGDLHFYDQEYNDAIISYSEAIQFLKQIPNEELNNIQFIKLIKNSLKLGLAYEKEGVTKDAKLLYFQISDTILQKRELPLELLGLSRFLISRGDINYFIAKHRSQVDRIFGTTNNGKIVDKMFKSNDIDEAIIMGRHENMITYDDNRIYPIKEMKTFYDYDGNYIAKNIKKIPLLIETNFLNLKLSTLEHIRLLYQPIMARLHLTEKASPNGVNKNDILRALSEFKYLTRTIGKDTKNIIITEFYNKLGDLLYYKNESLLSDNVSLTCASTIGNPLGGLYFYILGYLNLSPLVDDMFESFKNMFDNDAEKFISGIDVVAFSYEKDFKVITSKEMVELIVNSIVVLKTQELRVKHDANYLSALANSIIDIIDAYYSIEYEGNEVEDKIVNVVECYEKANDLFVKIGEFRLAKSQLIKVLMLYISESEKISVNRETYSLCIRLVYKSYRLTTIPEKWKFAEIFIEDEKMPDNYYDLSSLQNEIREIQVLDCLCKVKNSKFIDMDLFKDAYDFLNSSSTITHRYTRILEHKLRVKLNKILFEYINDTKECNYSIETTLNKIFDTRDIGGVKKFLIIDSIGALNESMKLHDLLGVNYISTGYLTKAKEHYRLFYWTKELEECNENDSKNYLHGILYKVLNTEKLRFLDSDYNLARAKFYNDKAFEMHNQDTAYKDFLSNKYYLDDDFNDNIVHFGFAKERAQMHKRTFSNKTDEIDRYYKSLDLFGIENY